MLPRVRVEEEAESRLSIACNLTFLLRHAPLMIMKMYLLALSTNMESLNAGTNKIDDEFITKYKKLFVDIPILYTTSVEEI